MAEDGGYAMHVDGTCEAGTDVLFTAMAEPRGWTLESAKMSTENTQEIKKLMRRCEDWFGTPLAVVRDLSPNIQKAKREAIPHARDLICHYHFLENVGEQLCEKPHAKLTNALRRLKVRPALRSLRKDLVRWSRKGLRLSRLQIDHLLSHPKDIADLNPTALRRFVAYVLLLWLDDYTADLRGEYFPFDLPTLAFYRRGLELSKMISKIVDARDFTGSQWSTLNTIAGHLAVLQNDAEVVATAERLEKASALFEELRTQLRLSSHPGKPLLRGSGALEPAESRETVEQVQKLMQTWRDQLRKRHKQERDEHKQADQATVLKYLQKYEHELVGHIVELSGGKEFVVCRTNNPVEHRFSSTKRGMRRKAGTKKLTRQVQAMRPEALLVCNLEDPEYVNLILGGSLANLPSAIAEHQLQAQAIRQQRLAPTTDHPMPATKKQIRNSGLLKNLKQTITRILKGIISKTQVA
jgi:hypothetical protein